jgi:hypothetical protein
VPDATLQSMPQKASRGPRQKKTPQRRCVACGQHGEKRSLLRLRRTAEDAAEIDESGRGPGRGAYLCTGSVSCADTALKKGRLERALRVKLAAGARLRLLESLHAMAGRNSQ